jgi:hypothetical protein
MVAANATQVPGEPAALAGQRRRQDDGEKQPDRRGEPEQDRRQHRLTVCFEVERHDTAGHDDRPRGRRDHHGVMIASKDESSPR